ncbi:response regulator transcription factor [Cohnella sp. JJ-181]|uniref:response regulator transcription factor n=1 Tax=Cohnella rhizoplanae TaxID=2974897 RepID=UPI0022FF63D9|nr:response regulator [Cohnella sp. JJ-181]CAI6087712.1 HTH-type transcriptional activator RhaR [Cohnella sp. JJ-181]
MYRVILADDEPEICRGLRLKIAWDRLGYEIAGEARNGKEALAAIESERPHLLLTDIRMPVMDGIELLQACKRLHPALRIVVLSGHDDFEYVQTALRCGARDYVLKPVVRRDLTALLETVRGELDEEREAARARDASGLQWRRRLPLLQEQYVLGRIYGGEEAFGAAGLEEARRLELAGFGAGDGAASALRFIGVEYRLPPGRLPAGEEDDARLALAFRLLCREVAAQGRWSGQVTPFTDKAYPGSMFFLAAAATEAESEALLAGLAEAILAAAAGSLRLAAVAGIGAACPAGAGSTALRRAYLSAVTAWSRAPAGPESRIVRADGLEGRAARPSAGSELIETIRRHIEDAYKDEISLAMLAERFHLNVTYLSELFKKQTGSTFSDYVAEVRLSRAELLLRDTSMRLADIAEWTGFSTASYLSAAFKKRFGLSPADYRARLREADVTGGGRPTAD